MQGEGDCHICIGGSINSVIDLLPRTSPCHVTPLFVNRSFQLLLCAALLLHALTLHAVPWQSAWRHVAATAVAAGCDLLLLLLLLLILHSIQMLWLLTHDVDGNPLGSGRERHEM